MMLIVSRTSTTHQICSAEYWVNPVLLSHQTVAATSRSASIFENEYPLSIRVRR